MPRSARPKAVTLAEAERQFVLDLKGQRLSPRTVSIYKFAVDALVACMGADATMSSITARDVKGCVLGYRRVKDGGEASAATLSAIYRGIQAFSRWAVGEGYLTENPTAGWKPPTVTPPTIRYPTEEELRKVLATCKRARSFLDARDEAILRVLIDTGARLSEVAGLTMDDVSLDAMVLSVRGKRSRGRERPRLVPFGAKAAKALDRYVTSFRTRHYAAGKTDALWLGRDGAITPNGIAQAVKSRGTAAGLPWLHAHALRHRFNAENLRSGMQETDLMALTGHTSRAMLDRYGAMTKAERAIEAYRRLSTVEV